MILTYRVKLVVLYCTTSFLFYTKVCSQNFFTNLVPDSSFEKQHHSKLYGACNVFVADSFARYMVSWTNPTNGTPDLYSYNYVNEGILRPPLFDSAKQNKCFGAPYCNYGGRFKRYYVFPKTGNSFLGLLYGKNTIPGLKYSYHREYVQSRLLKPVQKNHKYAVGLSYVCFPYSYEKAPFIDILFTAGQVSNHYTSECYINPDCTGFKQEYKPQVRFTGLQPFEGDTAVWATRTMVLKPGSDAAWLTLGRFKDELSFYNQMPCNATGSYFYIDDIFVREIPAIIAPDTVCEGETLELSSTLGMPYYWAADREGQTVLSRDSVYRITATQNMVLYAFGRYGSDSSHITVLHIPDPEWPDTIHVCEKQNYVLKAGAGRFNYRWQNGSKDSLQTISGSGAYTVLISDDHGCSNMLKTWVNREPLPQFNLPDDTTVCFNSKSNINLSIRGGYNCSWAPLVSDTCTVTMSEPGELTITATSFYGCKAAKIIRVHDACEPLVYIPDVFGPRMHEPVNRRWKPVVSYAGNYYVAVYNRWGQLLWKSEDPAEAWDGTFLGNPCEAGVYMAVIEIGGVHPYNTSTRRYAKTVQLLH